MNMRTVIILTLAIASGVGTVVAVKQMQSGEKAETKPVETVDVVVAAVELPKLKVLKAEDVALKAWPKDLVPPGAVSSIEDVTGKTIRLSKKTNQPIFASDVDAGRGIDVLIPAGKNMRLVSILTPSEAANVAGLVQPGDHIDVNLILTSSSREDSAMLTGGAQARLLLQNVLVVSVGQQVEVGEEKEIPGPYQSVTLAVTPQQSLTLQLAGSKGTLTLALRKSGDSDIVDVNPITLAELRSLGSRALQGDGTTLVAAETAEASETEETAEAEQVAPKERLVDVYRRIRTSRGTHSGDVFLRTQEMRRVVPEKSNTPEQSEIDTVAIPSNVGATTP